MPTATENLITALEYATARLAEMDTVPLTERARMTYTDAVQTYGWNEYRAALVNQIRETEALVRSARAAEQMAGGPWIVRTRGV